MDYTSQCDSVKDVEMASTSSVWHQPASAAVDTSKGTDLEKKYLIGTEIALARTIRNYSKQQSPVKKTNRKRQSNNKMWPCPPSSTSVSFLQDNNRKPQSKPSSSRPHSSTTQRKPSSKRLVKSHTLSALHTSSNTSTAKDLEMLTKSITKQLSKYFPTIHKDSYWRCCTKLDSTLLFKFIFFSEILYTSECMCGVVHVCVILTVTFICLVCVTDFCAHS